MTQQTTTDISQEISEQSQFIQTLKNEMGKVLVGQENMINSLIMSLIADGHILLEGLPGLAKTTAIKALADAIDTNFARIQFTPDLLPADLIGTEIYRPNKGDFTVRKGPVFTNLLLADEINRAPAKVQSALLEAMQERQVTIGENTYILNNPFLVLATQNPVEQEGTYPLPEAQIDRFMLKIKVSYPDRKEEKEIMNRMVNKNDYKINPVVSIDDILASRKLVDKIYLDPKIEDYIVDIIFATRKPALYKLESIEKLIEYGASPRATIYLAKAAKVQAFMEGRGYVTPQDVKTIGADVLRHRIHCTYEAEAMDLISDDLIQDIFNTVDVP